MALGEENDFRLPSGVRPRRYELRLVPDLDASTFVGEERIKVDILEATTSIVLNAVELEIKSATIEQSAPTGDGSVANQLPVAVEFDEELEQATLTAPNLLEPGSYLLRIEFSGILNDKLCGFYRSTYLDESGAERVIATTQFEETDARRAFPCFDEPEMKAAFSITLDVKDGLFAVSNSSVLEEIELDDRTRRVVFADTIVMSTYLVAFVVGPLEATDPIVAEGVAIRVVHLPGKANLTGPAIECAAHALGFYRRYFGIDYPADKLDLVALPDFAAGAMENLGCVTFREAILLADPETTSRPELQRLAEVVEHEIAHMWFGDLVTMRWWNGIWLNEAFATFMSLLCLDDYRPEWNCFLGFARDKAGALLTDGLHTTRPIEFPVRHPDEAAAMFDVLTYEKGASVLWMLERYVGADTFRAGVRRYLAAHLYANTETTDLWDAIEEETADGAVRSLMDTWIFQGGYPLVEVTRSSGEVEIAQRRFAYLSPTPVDSAIGESWIVPLIYRVDGEIGRLALGTDTVQVSAGEAPIVVNAGAAGFYRVRYAPEILKQLTAQLNELEPGERYNLIADLWAIAVAGVGETADFFGVVGQLNTESEPDVWSIIISALAYLDRFCLEKDRPTLEEYTRQVLGPQLARIGWEPRDGEGERVPLLRSSLIGALGNIGEDEAVIAKARELFVADHERHESVDPDLYGTVLGVVTAHATRAEFDQILDRYRAPESPMDQVRHLNCLVSLRDAKFAAEVREMCRGEVRSQNAPYLLSGMLRSREVGVDTWTFVKENFSEFEERFPANSIHRMLDGVSGLIEIDEHGAAPIAAEVRAFCDEHIDEARRRLVGQSLERLDINVAFAKRTRTHLADLLNGQGA